jgi:hypothetical protein
MSMVIGPIMGVIPNRITVSLLRGPESSLDLPDLLEQILSRQKQILSFLVSVSFPEIRV